MKIENITIFEIVLKNMQSTKLCKNTGDQWWGERRGIDRGTRVMLTQDQEQLSSFILIIIIY